MEELVEDGDEIVCLRVVDKDSKIASDPSVQQGIYKEEARSLLDSVQRKNEGGKSISLVLELAVGKVPETIQRMVGISKSPNPSLRIKLMSSTDQDLRPSLPHRRHPRPLSRRHIRPPRRLRKQILSSKLPCPRRRRPPRRQTQQEKSQTPRQPHPTRLLLDPQHRERQPPQLPRLRHTSRSIF